MNPQEFYTRHSAFSDPGSRAYLFDTLPQDIPGLCRVVQGIYRHYLFSRDLPTAQQQEVDSRYMPQMLSCVIHRDTITQPLTQARSPEVRFVGCCRDAALLLCAMLRHQEIPARIRVGFAAYIKVAPDFYVDHVVTEYWDSAAACWKLVDSEQSDVHIAENGITFNVHDIPRDQFIIGGRAWQMIRTRQVPADAFGLAPDNFFKGVWAVRNRLVHDLAALNKVEPLLWDTWGLGDWGLELNPEDETLLDRIAELTQAGDEAFAEIKACYEQHESLKVPSTVMSYSPLAEPRQVTLRL